MKLEDQVCSLDLAKELKKLGVPQESSFAWLVPLVGYKWILKCLYGAKFARSAAWVSAFTVAELGEMLPWVISPWGNQLEMETHFQSNGRFWMRYAGIEVFKIDGWVLFYAHLLKN